MILVSLYNICLVNNRLFPLQSIGEQVTSLLMVDDEVLNYVFTLLAHQKTFINACQLIEDMLQSRKEVLDLHRISKYTPVMSLVLPTRGINQHIVSLMLTHPNGEGKNQLVLMLNLAPYSFFMFWVKIKRVNMDVVICREYSTFDTVPVGSAAGQLLSHSRCCHFRFGHLWKQIFL